MSRVIASNARLVLVLARHALLTACAVLALDRAVSAEGPPLAGAGADDAPGEWFRPEADPASLKRALEESHISDRWIYHDLVAARRRARETGKPILVTFRCVPCGSAPGLDGAVCTAGGAEASRFEDRIGAAGGDLAALLDRFVTVRMVKMNGVDRNVFQFDRDVPYVAMFLNADGVVYGRYGTRVSEDRRNLPRHNLSSFRESLRRALELHQDYPRNRTRLAAKRAVNRAPAMVEDMTSFKPFPPEHNPPGVANCIHCHTAGEAEVRETMTEGRLAARDVWPFPLPDNIGLKIAADHGLKVESVRTGSPAERAGMRSGDVLLRLADQPLTSEADIQWALHHAPDEGSVPVAVRRGDRTVEAALSLEGEWRRGEVHWRSSLSPLRPNLHLRPDPYKVKKGAGPDRMGLEVRYPRGAAAEAGLRSGDLLVSVDGRSDMHLEADFLRYIHIERPEARRVELTVIRKGEKLAVSLPIR